MAVLLVERKSNSPAGMSWMLAWRKEGEVRSLSCKNCTVTIQLRITVKASINLTAGCLAQ